MSLGGQPGSPWDLERHGGGEGTTQDSGLSATVSGGGSLSVCVEEGAGSPPAPPVGGLAWDVGEAALPEATVKMSSRALGGCFVQYVSGAWVIFVLLPSSCTFPPSDPGRPSLCRHH